MGHADAAYDGDHPQAAYELGCGWNPGEQVFYPCKAAAADFAEEARDLAYLAEETSQRRLSRAAKYSSADAGVQVVQTRPPTGAGIEP